MTDEFDARLEAACRSKGVTTREGLVFDQSSGELSDIGAWELGLEEAELTERLAPTAIRYIKLGPGGAWFNRCIHDGLIELGHAPVPHKVAAAGDWAEAKAIYDRAGAKSATGFIRELKDFYTLPDTALWITIAQGRLWWAFAESKVFEITGEGRGARARRVIGQWRSTDRVGDELRLSELSTRLTKVAAYQQTVCSVEAEAYLLLRLNAEKSPLVLQAEAAQQAVVAAASALIARLHQNDFELMVDLIFAASGWRRVSAVGGSSQADTDLVLEQRATGETAFVQVKSRAEQAVLDDYLQRFGASGHDRFFFVCHTTSGGLALPEGLGLHLWLGADLAEQAVAAGLLDWLIARNG